MTEEEMTEAFDRYEEKFGEHFPLTDFASVEDAAKVALEHVRIGEPYDDTDLPEGALS